MEILFGKTVEAKPQNIVEFLTTLDGLIGLARRKKKRAIFHSRKKFRMDQPSNLATAIDNAELRGKEGVLTK